MGTCYLTQSHPEKKSEDLEGPRLPGLVKRGIQNHIHNHNNIILEEDVDVDADINVDAGVDVGKVQQTSSTSTPSTSPIIFAIGGIEMENCHEPVEYGSDGIAVIRSVMQASDPADAVHQIKTGMKGQTQPQV